MAVSLTCLVTAVHFVLGGSGWSKRAALLCYVSQEADSRYSHPCPTEHSEAGHASNRRGWHTAPSPSQHGLPAPGLQLKVGPTAVVTVWSLQPYWMVMEFLAFKPCEEDGGSPIAVSPDKVR